MKYINWEGKQVKKSDRRISGNTRQIHVYMVLVLPVMFIVKLFGFRIDINNPRIKLWKRWIDINKFQYNGLIKHEWA